MIPLALAPLYSRSAFKEFQQTGTIAALNNQLDLEPPGIAYFKDSLTEQFHQAQAWDETDRDQFRGQPGVVRVLNPAGTEWGGYLDAAFSGDEKQGELLYHESIPQLHAGQESVSLTNFSPNGLDSVEVAADDLGGQVFNPRLVHLDTQSQTGYVRYRGQQA